MGAVDGPSEHIERLPVDSLVPYARNARTHSDGQVAEIAASIKEFGFTNPVLIDDSGGVIAGHGRLMAARRLGMTDVPCIRLSHLSDVQKRAYILADNRIALNADWDDDMLRIELEDLDGEGFDLSLLGFSEDEINALLEGEGEDEGTEGLTDPDDTPDPEKIAVSKAGDVWVLGKHRVMCGDSTDLDCVIALMGGALADVFLTDPPYNVAYEGGTQEKLTIKNDSMSDAVFLQFLTDAFVSANSVMRPGAAFYIWHADMEGYNFRRACRDIGWKVRQCPVWVKNTLVMGRQDYHARHEPCLYGWKDGSAHQWASDRKQSTVWEFDKPSRNGEHPTMKPVALFEYQLLNNTNKGGVVLDLFGGSGTTVIAAEKNGRVSRIMELDPIYCDVIVRRWQEFTGKQGTRESDGAAFDQVASGVMQQDTSS